MYFLSSMQQYVIFKCKYSLILFYFNYSTSTDCSYVLKLRQIRKFKTCNIRPTTFRRQSEDVAALVAYMVQRLHCLLVDVQPTQGDLQCACKGGDVMCIQSDECLLVYVTAGAALCLNNKYMIAYTLTYVLTQIYIQSCVYIYIKCVMNGSL